MTQADRVALEALNSRFDHTAAIARLVAHHTNVDADTAAALRGIAATLDDLCGRLDALANSGEGVSS
ncbi:hypothetical protein [Sphingomonas sp. S-NIH.Pt1_0416]|uniref:hypothetical protein n=1 Tax=Sphingomonas sp. S-NIH.Pt1_0416 TaxID=1920123 RepID=UPI000F7E5293|nr:hypothetical protein [Sphingomonas sp. S-NIH.Pt1_0416]